MSTDKDISERFQANVPTPSMGIMNAPPSVNVCGREMRSSGMYSYETTIHLLCILLSQFVNNHNHANATLTSPQDCSNILLYCSVVSAVLAFDMVPFEI